MNITCSICEELFVPTSDVYFTPCGHFFHLGCITQWLERASTCPECRAKVTTGMMHKAFFNCTHKTPELDPELMTLIGVLKDDILLKDTLLRTCEIDNESMKDQVARLGAEVERLQVDIVQHKSLNQTYEEQIKHLEDLKVKLEYEKKMESNAQRYEESQERMTRLERDNLLEQYSRIFSASASRSTESQRQSIESVGKQRSQASDEQRNNVQLNRTMERDNAHSKFVEQLVKRLNINTFKTPKFDENRVAMDSVGFEGFECRIEKALYGEWGQGPEGGDVKRYVEAVNRPYRQRPPNPPPNPPSGDNSNNQPSGSVIQMPDTRFPSPNMVRANQFQNAASSRWRSTR